MTNTRLNLASVPLLPVTVAFIIGILAAGSAYAIWASVGFIALCIGLYCVGYKYVALILATVATGIVVGVIGRPVPLPAGFYGHRAMVSGVVTEMNEGDATRNLVVRVDSINSISVRPFKVFTICWNFHPEITAGDHITYVSELSPVDTSVDIPLELNYGQYLYDHGIVATSFIKEGKDVISLYQASGLMNDMSRLKDRIVNYIAASRLSSSGKTFMITMLTGDRTYITPDARLNFARAGVAHVLALSGLHVAIITIIISLLLFPLTALRLNRLKGLVTVGLLWIFALVTGLTPSVVRSVIMATVFLLCMLLERRPSPLNSLCFAALCILTADALAIYSIGFQLSFIAVVFILIFSERFIPFSRKQRLPYLIAGWFATSFSAAMGTGVIAAVYFHVFPVYFLAVNIPFTFLLPLTIGGGVVFLLLGYMGFQPAWLIAVLDFLCEFLEDITAWVATLPGSYIDGIFISPARLILFLLAMAAVAVLLYYPGRKTLFLSASAVAIVVIYSMLTPAFTYDSNIYFPRYKRYSVVLVPQRPVMKVFTTATLADLPELNDIIDRRYFHYMNSRGIDSVEIIQVHNSIVNINAQSIVFTDTIPEPGDRVNSVVILTRGFQAHYISDSSALPDTVYISPCMNDRIAGKVIAALTERGIKALNLKETGMVIRK